MSGSSPDESVPINVPTRRMVEYRSTYGHVVYDVFGQAQEVPDPIPPEEPSMGWELVATSLYLQLIVWTWRRYYTSVE